MGVLKTFTLRTRKVDILVNDLKNEAYLCFPDGMCEEEEYSIDMVRDMLEEAGIQSHHNKRGIAAALKEGHDGHPHLIAQSPAPEDGENGYVDFFVEPRPEVIQFDLDDYDNIDYRETNLIENVIADRPLCKEHPPGEGSPGKDLFGNEIPAKNGDSAPYRFRDNLSKVGDAYYATVNGRFVVENDQLFVSPIYRVPGSVDYSIGNINFVGEVEVMQDVFDEFTNTCEGNLTIHGNIGSSDVTCKGSAEVEGGMNGKGRGSFNCDGDLVIKYCNEANVFCHGNSEVGKQLVNSHFRTSGKLSIPHGQIISGKTFANKGLEVGMLGRISV